MDINISDQKPTFALLKDLLISKDDLGYITENKRLLDKYIDTPLEKHASSNIERSAKNRNVLIYSHDVINVLVLNKITQLETFKDIILKFSYFYVNFSRLKIYMVSDFSMTSVLVENDYSSEIQNYLDIFKSNIVISSEFEVLRDINFDYSFNTDVEDDLTHLSKSFITKIRTRPIYRIDKEKQRHEGSFYNYAILVYYAGFKDSVEEEQSKFRKVLKRLQSEKIYLFASGPTLGSFRTHNYEDGLRVVCNTLILNDEFWNYVKPNVLVFADPIFHLGCSSYAEDFLNSVEARLEEDSSLVVLSPMNYRYLLYRRFSKYWNRIICVPFSQNSTINLDLDKNFSIQPTDNIFTLLMLPFAATIGKSISVIGFDGKPLSMNDTFWGYDKKSQNEAKYGSLVEIHPGFFNLDYTDFYLKHCETVNRYIARIEAKGIKFTSLEFSHIPALRKRRIKTESLRVQAKNRLFELIESSNCSTIFLSLNPDCGSSDLGHFYNYDKSLKKSLRKDENLFMLAGAEFDDSAIKDFAVPWFSHNSWCFNRPNDIYTELLQDELNELKVVLEGFSDKQFVLFQYMGTVKHLKIFSDTFGEANNCSIHLNLFGEHEALITNKVNIQVSDNVHVYHESESLLKSVKSETSFYKELHHWPMIVPTTSFLSDDPSPTKTQQTIKKIYFTSTPQLEKGFDTILDFVELCVLKQLPYCSVVRKTHHIENIPLLKSKLDLLQKRNRQHIEVIDGHKNDADFKVLYEKSDIVVIPYRVKHFQYKTSGTVIDAAILGKPVISVAGTWAGDLIQDNKLGDVFKDGDATDLLSKIENFNLSEFFDSASFIKSKFSPTELLNIFRNKKA